MTKIEIEGLPHLPEGYVGVRWGLAEKGDVILNPWENCWITASEHFRSEHRPIAIPAPPPEPWYPPSWYDADGKLLPDVFEHDGGWPKCNPNDQIEFIAASERKAKMFERGRWYAGSLTWHEKLNPVVAIRVVERVSR